jgi:CheY-like chemotaxis protein
VVDDKEENRALIQAMFDGPEYRVLEAADGTTGLALAQRERLDCILLDLNMPGLTGFEVLERLEADPPARGRSP